MMTFKPENSDSCNPSPSGRENKTTERENLVNEGDEKEEECALERIQQMKEVKFGNWRDRSFGKMKKKGKRGRLKRKG